MLFRRIIYNALLVGLITGLLLTAIQLFSVNPIIFAAEAYELEETHDHGEHDHEAWAPREGLERTLSTTVANISASIGFAAILLALMSQVQIRNMQPINILKGSLWGLAGFVTIFVVPGIGLPPEIPGIQAAAVEHRQLWWIFAVICAGIGLAIIAFAAMKLKAIGLLFLALPYLVGAPHIEGPEFAHPDPTAVSALEQLHEQFILVSGITNLLFWLALGISCSWVLNRWVLQGISRDVTASD